ncbi:glycoside hydrolase family 11 protein [Ruminococcus sp.]|uniref:glycoside hydrolase family 11 protein n=1 Tax=Ruminococcus sp. TaxID=41978 RepID=UPI0025CDC460|nr:glycoside hydrolase family 11 protein [Ruminococcus sp.]
MKLSLKKNIAAVAAAVCLFGYFSDAVVISAADDGGFSWGNTADGFNSNSEWVSWGASSNGSTLQWGDQGDIIDDEVSLYVTETPDPEAKKLKEDHISGQCGSMVYNIDKKSGDNGNFTFANGTQDGFKASWSDLEALCIEKGNSFKKPINISFFKKLSVDYKAVLDGFSGDKLDIGARCPIGSRDDYMYIIDHFGEFELDDDMEELEPLEYYGKVYQVYKKVRVENTGGETELTHTDYYLIYIRDINELSSEPELKSSVMVSDIANIFGMTYKLSPILGCYFYIDTYGGDGDIDVKYILVNSGISVGLPGMYPWKTNVWGTYEGSGEDIPCILYPDEDGYYYFYDGTGFNESGNNLGNGTEITCADNFGRDDNYSIKVECSKDYFLGDPSKRYLAYIGNVGYPFKKSFWGDWNNTQQGFSFGPLYPADEDYLESDITYDISVDVYNNSDEETEFSLEISCPARGFGISDEQDDKIRKYESNVVCKKAVKPHEWITLSNSAYAMPRALTGNLLLYTNGEIEYYVDNIAVKEPEGVLNIRGDINGDGVIDSFDLVQYRKAFFTGEIKRILPRRADIDGDGDVLINDIVLLKRFLLGIDKELDSKEKINNDKRENGVVNGHYYESFIKNGIGEIKYDVSENGCFECKISDADQAWFECDTAPENGIRLDEVKSLYHVYDGEIVSDDGYLFGIHGKFADSSDEFYIIEESGHDSRFAGITAAKTVNIEGYNYRLYILNKTKETPEGKIRYSEYWSVLDDLSISEPGFYELRGQINILKHINNWEKICGLRLNSKTLSSVGLFVGGSKQYSQSFKVSKNELFIDKE